MSVGSYHPHYIVVLGSEHPKPNGRFPNVFKGMYLGGQVRMDAAVEAFRRYPSALFILVGGKKRHISKAADMDAFLRKYCPDIKTALLDSLPCTRHNFISLFEKFGEKFRGKKIALLTNAYHMPRALLFWTILRKRFPIARPMPAESLVPDISYNYPEARRMRMKLEEQGLKEIIAGTYKDSCHEKK